ncbi:tyrosinase cofactor [Planosporangium flavigriseum]|uniref:Tyrosinase co-factor MelC1 n=2 Tax=Planosporangium flavigriseum TaxID=373681 RepID=A0A8J3LR27_9ACTN|nr:hypothetical protein Pfl04_00090 [Planosporangium flavigriseum]
MRIAAVGIMGSTAAAVTAQQLTTHGSRAAGDTAETGVTAEHFDEVYQGRRISGSAGTPLDAKFSVAQTGAHVPVALQVPIEPQVLIDGRALHVMTNADGTYTSVVNHYQSFRSLREVARAAVDSLGTATLSPVHHHG